MNKPGYTFEAIAKLVYDHHWQLHTLFTDARLLTLFWEETQLKNVPQLKGTAVGLRHVEPAELWTLRQYGIATNAKNILNDPAHAVEVTSYYLRHLFELQSARPRSRQEALKRYAGYDYDRAAWRLKVIAGWQACERALLSINGRWSDEPGAVLSALAQSRSFDKTDPAVRSALFPG